MIDQKTEQWLKRGGYKFDYHKVIRLTEIDYKTSVENPSRLAKQLNDDKVQEYGLKMEAGVEFPALLLILIDPGSGRKFKYDILTGCHRYAAADLAGKKTFDGYVVIEADDYRIEWAARMANTIEGTAPSLRDTLTQLCEMHTKYKKTLSELARQANVKIQTLNNFWHEEQAIRRAQKYGYDSKRHKIGRTALISLAGIHSEVVFEKAIKTILNYGSTNQEIEQLARDIKKTRDEATATRIIDDYVKATADFRMAQQAKHGRAQPTKAVQLRGYIRNTVNLIDGGLDKLHLGSMPRLDMFKVLIAEAQEKMKALAAEVDKIERINRATPEQPGVVH
jgi:hypothetical protein